ncbi:MAG TPA: toast rack family protein [Anaerolineales bacterium]|nr:toast rack family protein [Anaerolineales bacterium]
MNIKIISAVLVLALASLACGITVDLPEQARVGPEIKDSITVAVPKLGLSDSEGSDEAQLGLSFGAGDLTISTGAENLVDGTALYNVRDLKPEIINRNGEIEIRQGDFESIPPFEGMKNEWDLKLGKTPMDLTIAAGAYDGYLELGGLSLKSLAIQDGASDVELSFSEPNRVEMSTFSYTTGASNVMMEGLANANFRTFVFNSGAGDYTLDFSGELQRDATVSIDCGFSDLNLIIPKGVQAVVTIDSALADIHIGEGWSQKNNVYTQEGEGYLLTILINMGAGDVSIRD